MITYSNTTIKQAKTKWSKESVEHVINSITFFNNLLETSTTIDNIYTAFAYMYECWLGGDVDINTPVKCFRFIINNSNAANWESYKQTIINKYTLKFNNL